MPPSVLQETNVSVKRRRVRRVIRTVDPWSVLRFSVVFYLCVFAVLLVAGVILWVVAATLGVVHNIENFIGDLLALDHFRFRPMEIFRAAALGGLVLVVLGTGANVVATWLFNLISQLTGGIAVTVEEEDPAAQPPRPVI